MVDPIELIGRSRRRLARLAVGRVWLAGTLPVTATLAFALCVNSAAAWVWRRWGYLIPAHHVGFVRMGLFVAAGVEAAAIVALGLRAWRRADDFTAAASKIDDLIGARQELLTLAELANPAAPEMKERRSPLFAILWRRSIGYLDNFDPRESFRLAPAAELRRSSIFTAVVLAVLSITLIALMRAPDAIQIAAYRLRQLAAGLSSAATAGERQIAVAALAVANDLDNPHLPPQQKLAELESIRREIEKTQAPKAAERSDSASGRGSGKGSGSGEGGGGQGAGGSGEGGGGSQSGKSGQGAGSGNHNGQPDQTRMTLQNDISKAEAKLETESASNRNLQTAPKQNDQGSGTARQPGANPHQAGAAPRPDGAGDVPIPQPDKLAQGQAPLSSGNPAPRRDDKSTQGDTHLGEFPKSMIYERFYKPGDKGPPLELKDARYVTFRLPTAAAAGDSNGRLVHDSGTHAATTPYTNAPLKEQRLVASPDEEQLLPPRYRDLIR